MTVSWEQSDRHTELIYYRGSLGGGGVVGGGGGGGGSAGAEADGRQPGYFLRQRSKASGHLHREGLDERAQLFKLEHGLCDKNSQAAATFTIYLIAMSQKHLHTCAQLQFTKN